MKEKSPIRIYVSLDYIEIANSLYAEYSVVDMIDNIWLLYASLIKDEKVGREILQDMLLFCTLQQRLIIAIYDHPLPDSEELLDLIMETEKKLERAASLD